MSTPNLTQDADGAPLLTIEDDFNGGLAVGLTAAKGVIERALELGRLSDEVAAALLRGILASVTRALENATYDEED